MSPVIEALITYGNKYQQQQMCLESVEEQLALSRRSVAQLEAQAEGYRAELARLDALLTATLREATAAAPAVAEFIDTDANERYMLRIWQDGRRQLLIRQTGEVYMQLPSRQKGAVVQRLADALRSQPMTIQGVVQWAIDNGANPSTATSYLPLLKLLGLITIEDGLHRWVA